MTSANEDTASGVVADFHRLLRVFNPTERRRLVLLTIAQVIGAGLEVSAVGLILPLVALFADPTRINAYPRLASILRWFGIGQPSGLLLVACAAVLAFYVLKNVYLAFLLGAQYRLVFSKQAALSADLLARYMRSPWTLHLRRNSAELLRNILHQVTLFISNVLNPFLVLISEGLVSLAVVGLLVFVQPVAAILALIVVGGAGAIVYRNFKKRAEAAGAAQQEYLTRMIQWVNQAFGGLKETKLLGKEQYFIDAYADCAEGYVREHRFIWITSNIQRLVLETLLVAGFLLVTGTLILGGNDLAAVLPTMALFGVAAFRLLPSVNRVIVSLAGIRYHWPVVENLDRELAELERYAVVAEAAHRGENAGAAPELSQRISVRNVTFRYPGADADALSAVSLEIPRGSAVAITGPSGAGKTTLVDVILGLLVPRAGAVHVDETDIASCASAWQRKIGYVPQHVYLLDDSVRRNVALGVPDTEIDECRVWQALEQAQVADVVRAMRDGLDTRLGEHGARLSGGQRQRIGIARSLYNRPEVLVFDEATSAVDVETERQLSEAIDRLGGERTLIIIAHRESTIAKCAIRFKLERGCLLSTESFSTADVRASQ